MRLLPSFKKNRNRQEGNRRRCRLLTPLRVEPLEQRQMLSVAPIQAHLEIFIDGEEIDIPADIGVDSSSNISTIYTVDGDGTLEIAPVDDGALLEAVTVGDFFDTWRTNAGLAGNNDGAVFDGEQILGHYVAGDYDRSFFHRSVTDFVIQAGGYTTYYDYFYGTWQFEEISTDSTIENEPGISNTRGTVAMAKLGGDPDSATSQFFVNLGDNSFLDSDAYDAFTVFGRVLNMTPVETIADLEIDTTNASPYDELPLTSDNQLAVIMSVDGEGTVSGRAFEDLDFDGVQDSGEAGLGGLTVFADTYGNGILDDTEYSTTTDANGDYLLRLPAGTHIIRQAATTSLAPTTPDNSGAYSVSVEIGRGTDGYDFANISDSPPTGLADAYFVDEDGSLSISADEGVLANDSDAEGDSLWAVLIASPENGTLTLNSDGSFTYAPDADFYGTDTFTYAASDDYSQSSAIAVTITVAAVSDAPRAAADTLTIPADDGTQALDVLANDSTDPDGTQSLSIIAVTQGSMGGTVTIPDDQSSIDYTPATGFTGSETFTYTIEDSDGLTDQTTVTVTVSDEVATDDTVIYSPGTISGFVYFDGDRDGQRDDGEAGIPGSLLTLTGTDDDGNSVSQTILSANDGSYVFADLAPGIYTVVQQQPAALLDGTNEAGTLGGTAIAGGFSGIALGEGEYSAENNFGELAVRRELISIRLFLSSTPSYEQCLRNLIARAEDAAGNTELAAWIREGLIEVPPTDANRAPIAQNDSYSINEDATLTVSAASGVLANDSDADGDSLTAVLVSNPSHGSLSLNADGVTIQRFTYGADDGWPVDAAGGGKTLEVADVSGDYDDPTNWAASSAAGGSPGSSSVAAGPVDYLMAALVESPLHGVLNFHDDGSFEYEPEAGYIGTDQFSYRANDGGQDSNEATVTITIGESES